MQRITNVDEEVVDRKDASDAEGIQGARTKSIE